MLRHCYLGMYGTTKLVEAKLERLVLIWASTAPQTGAALDDNFWVIYHQIRPKNYGRIIKSKIKVRVFV